VSLTFDVVRESAVNVLVRLQRLLVVAAATMTAGDHQLPANLSWPAMNSTALQCSATHGSVVQYRPMQYNAMKCNATDDTQRTVATYCTECNAMMPSTILSQ